jgi:hypothetical protein
MSRMRQRYNRPGGLRGFHSHGTVKITAGSWPPADQRRLRMRLRCRGRGESDEADEIGSIKKAESEAKPKDRKGTAARG